MIDNRIRKTRDALMALVDLLWTKRPEEVRATDMEKVYFRYGEMFVHVRKYGDPLAPMYTILVAQAAVGGPPDELLRLEAPGFLVGPKENMHIGTIWHLAMNLAHPNPEVEAGLDRLLEKLKGGQKGSLFDQLREMSTGQPYSFPARPSPSARVSRVFRIPPMLANLIYLLERVDTDRASMNEDTGDITITYPGMNYTIGRYPDDTYRLVLYLPEVQTHAILEVDTAIPIYSGSAEDEELRRLWALANEKAKANPYADQAVTLVTGKIDSLFKSKPQ